MNTNKLYQTAIHEAGHSVMSVIRGRGVEYVTIISSGKSLGKCKNIKDISNEYEDNETRGLRMQSEVLILIAGTTSEVVILGISPLDSRGAEDYKQAEEILDAPNDGLTQERANYIHKLAYSILDNPLVKEQIKAVADKLMERKTLSGVEVRKIMKGAEVKG